MRYTFDIQLKTSNFTIDIDSFRQYGYFEHNELGDNLGGGLWFETNSDGKRELIDCDGVFELPWEVSEALRTAGFVVGEEFD